MATPPDPDGALPLAKRRLSDCVHALADPVPVWHDGAARWQGSLYDRLRAELAGGAVFGRRQAFGLRSPCHTGILALLVEIDATVGSWVDGKGTVDRLHVLVDRGWRPQDCELIGDYCSSLERWVLAGTELLDPAPVVWLPHACPRCGARAARRRDGCGELVRTQAALRVSESGCSCAGCGAFWGPDRFEWLARLLGCEPLPA